MWQKISLPLLCVLVLLGGALRLYNVSGRSTYEWDQARDHEVVSAMVSEQKPVLVGPVIQGQGGFMLGPLYYYLLLPAHLIMDGDPLGHPLTSILLDLVFIVALYLAGNHLARPGTGAIAALIWTISAYTIRLSLVSWNVSLVPFYTLGAIALGITLARHVRLRYLLLSLFWFGLAWHIHPSVIFQIPLILWLNAKQLSHFSLKSWLLAALALLIPLTPWLVFDLRHEYINAHLLSGFLSSSSLPDSLGLTLTSLWHKYAYELSQLVLGRQSIIAGTLLIILQLLWLVRTRTVISRFLMLNLAFNTLALLVMRSVDFGNYYLLNLLVTNVWMMATLITAMRPSYRLVLVSAFLILNAQEYRFATQPFSLAIKAQVLDAIAEWSNPVDLEISLPVGRRSGFEWYLANRSQLRHDDAAPNVAYIVESDQLELTAPQKARSIVIERTIGGFRFVGYEGNSSVK